MLLFKFIDLLRSEFLRIGPWWWMAWNTMLALIPVVLAIVLLRRAEQPRTTISTVVFFAQLVLIMLFLPNAPYVATDLIHFAESIRFTEHDLWYLLGTEFPLYVAFVIVGLASYSFVTDRILFALRKRFGRRAMYVGLVAIPFLCSVGIYLGRVARFNSWDILRDPLDIARSSRTALADSRMAIIILAMTVLLFIVHQVYKLIHDGLRVRIAEYQQSREAMRRHQLRVARRKVTTSS